MAQETNTRRLTYQLLNGVLRHSVVTQGSLVPANLDTFPGYLTPLATLSWNSGNEVSMRYIFGAPPDGDADRSACTTLITTS